MSCFWEWALIKAILGHICCLSLLINFAFMVEYSAISTVLMHAMTMRTAKSYNCVSLWLSPGWRQNSWSVYRCFANRYRRVDFTLYTMYTGTCKTSLKPVCVCWIVLQDTGFCLLWCFWQMWLFVSAASMGFELGQERRWCDWHRDIVLICHGEYYSTLWLNS